MPEFLSLAEHISIDCLFDEPPNVMRIGQFSGWSPVMARVLLGNDDLLFSHRLVKVCTNLLAYIQATMAGDTRRGEGISKERHAPAKESRLDEDIVEAATPRSVEGRDVGEEPPQLLNNGDRHARIREELQGCFRAVEIA